ncbi:MULTISPECIES: hypothetical protein [unclassified Streptomyces]|uniref:hypothetical protein n=1 Tax=unclassified Streptomyces TaxID=2593676 RepID=UPI002E24A491|nr:hypothetical protein OG760_37830 [Streptomyces sp. NBC_00963]
MNTPLPNPGHLLDIAHWIAMSAPYLALMVLLGGAAWGWTHWQRARRVEETLLGRVTVELIPTSTFDPSEGEVRRYAHQLSRARYSVAKTPARGAGVRLRYSAEEGHMRCYVEGPARAGAVLAMPGFAEVEVRAARADQHIEPVRFTPPVQREGEK